MELAGDISNIKSEIKKLMETVTGVEDLKNKFDGRSSQNFLTT